jgi:hypothetical protein
MCAVAERFANLARYIFVSGYGSGRLSTSKQNPSGHRSGLTLAAARATISTHRAIDIVTENIANRAVNIYTGTKSLSYSLCLLHVIIFTTQNIQ